MNEIDLLLNHNSMVVKRMESMSPMLAQFFGASLLKIHEQMPTSHGGLLMGCPVWGRPYIDRMVKYSLPTLGSPRNIKYLSGKAVLVFFCFEEDRPYLWEATRWLRQERIHTLFRDLPPGLREIAIAKERDDKYGILAPVQNLLAHMAGHAEMGLHMYMPDHVYCDGYFESLAKLGTKYPAIVHQGMSLDASKAMPELDKWRQVDNYSSISIPALRLGDLTISCMHPRSSQNVMNYGGSIPTDGGTPVLPDCRQVAWIGKDALHIADPCHLVAWLCPELCLDAPISFTSTLDMLHPDYIPPGMWHMAGPDDGMVFAELSEPSSIVREWVGLERFLMRAWQQVAFTPDYMPYLSRRCLIRISEQAGYLSDAEIDRQHRWILDAMAKGKRWAMEAYFRGQCPPRWPEEPEPVREAA